MIKGLIIEYLIGRFKDNHQKQPLIVFDWDGSFRHFADVFKERIDYQYTINVVDRDPKKLATVIDVEALANYPSQLSDYLEQIKPGLVELNCAVFVCEGWRWPNDFLKWLSDAREQKKFVFWGFRA